jgi:hypothetical protein
MDFKKFLEMMSEAESTAEKDNKAEKAGKKVAKDIEYDEGHKGKDDKKAEKAGEKVKKDIEYDDKKDKKSLKDWFEIIDKKMIAEAEQITIEPAKQNTQVIRQGDKTVGTVTNPQLAAQIKQSIGKGEMSLTGTNIKEDDLDEKWAGDAEVKPTGQYKDKTVAELKSMLAKLKKGGPHGKDSPAAKKMRQINFALRAKGGWKKGEGAAMKEEELAEKAKNPYAIGMAQAMKSTGDKPPLEKSTITKAHKIAKKIKKTDEGEIPSSGPDYGAGLGAGRNDKVLEAKPDFLDLDKDGNKKESMKKAAADKKKKKVDEAMNTLEAAYHEGKSHGLSKHSYACRYNEGSEEHRRYHEGFKEGLDECYGLMPNRGLVGETMPAATVPGMASQAMPAMEAEMDEGNAFTAALAKADKGEKFTVGGKTFTDRSDYNAKIDEFAFESLNKQLDELLNEGVSVNMSQGLNDGMGGHGGDSVSVTATDDDAAKLLDFIKQVGLGGLGAAAAEKEVVGGVEPIAAVSDYGAPKFSGHDDMKALVAKVDDYKDEEGHGDAPEMKMCGTHKLPEGECGCHEGKEMVDEVETEDQLTYQVAEDDGEGYEQSQADAGKIDSALALSGASKGGAVSEGGDGGEASEEDDKETSGDAGEGGAEDVSDEQEKLDEWANDAGKDGTDQAFERDIDFMTKIISGGLNKPKSTGQTTIPVIAGQEARMGDEDVTAWKRLAGLIK